VNIDEILLLLSPNYLNQEVLLAHDWAREKFRLPTIKARDHREFKYLVTIYVQHHMDMVGEGRPSDRSAFGIAMRIVNNSRELGIDQYQEGYSRALQIAVDGSMGGMRLIIDEIANGLKRQAVAEHTDHVYHEYINVNSKADNLALSKAYFGRFGSILRQFGADFDEDTFAWNTRAALDYHRQVIENILGIARKI